MAFWRTVSAADPIRVGLIGYGVAGSVFHAPLIEAEPSMALVAVVTGNPERRARAGERHPDADVVPTVDALLESAGGLDLAVVAIPNRGHVPVATACLRAGLGVVVDKPLAHDAAAARPLLEEARARGAFLSVFHNRRWDGDFLTARRLVASGALGEVVRLESRFDRWRPQVRAGAWRESADPGDGGGVLLDLGPHLVDQALILGGRVSRVYAEVQARRAGASADDDAFVALEHEGGVRSHLYASMVAGIAAPRLRVVGTAGTYEKHGMDPQEEALRAGERPGGPHWGREPAERWGRLGGDSVRTVATEPGDYGAFYRGVAAALREGTVPPVTGEEALTVLEVLDAARRSALAGRVVELPQGRP